MMSNDPDSLYILAQNIELAHFRIAQVRQVLLDHQMLDSWLKLIEATEMLNAAQNQLAEMPKS